MRIINEAGKKILKRAEGLPGTDGAPALETYLDDAGVPTNGWGHTKGVRMGQQITVQQAEDFFGGDIAPAEEAVQHGAAVALSDNQFAALVIFAFNVGLAGFRGSTLLKVLNAGQYTAVPDQLRRWNKVRDPKTGAMVESHGLNNRRQIEIDLWNTP